MTPLDVSFVNGYKRRDMSTPTDKQLDTARWAVDFLAAMQSPEAIELADRMVAEFGDAVAASIYCRDVGNGCRRVNPALVDRYRAAHAIIEERIAPDTLR